MAEQLPGHLKKLKLSWNDTTCVKFTDENSMFRYILKEHTEPVRVLFESGLIDNLAGKGLLQPGTLRETNIPEYPLVIEHPLINHISYPFEWPALALKDTALAILEIEETANSYGYSLYDPNPYNATIQNSRPVYLDYGSFVPIAGTPIWYGYDKAFRDTILFPLELYEKKLHYVARLVLREITSHSLDSTTRKLAGNKFQRSFLDKLVIAVSNRGDITSDKLHYRLAIAGIDKVLSNRFFKSILEGATYKVRPSAKEGAMTATIPDMDTRYRKAIGSRGSFLKRLKKRVESLKVSEGSSHWSAYYENIVGTRPPWERDTATWTAKELNIQEIVSELNPKSALDIGANTGWFSIMLAHNGASVVSLERDEECINQLYSYTQKENTDILPLAMDIQRPSPMYELNTGTISAATERLKCDMVMALAIIHHIVSNQSTTLEHLAYNLNMFTERYLLVEFVPVNEELYKLPLLNEDNWNIPVFKEAFSKYFDYKGIWDSYPEGRKLLLFQKSDTE